MNRIEKVTRFFFNERNRLTHKWGVRHNDSSIMKERRSWLFLNGKKCMYLVCVALERGEFIWILLRLRCHGGKREKFVFKRTGSNEPGLSWAKSPIFVTSWTWSLTSITSITRLSASQKSGISLYGARSWPQSSKDDEFLMNGQTDVHTNNQVGPFSICGPRRSFDRAYVLGEDITGHPKKSVLWSRPRREVWFFA